MTYEIYKATVESLYNHANDIWVTLCKECSHCTKCYREYHNNRNGSSALKIRMMEGSNIFDAGVGLQLVDIIVAIENPCDQYVRKDNCNGSDACTCNHVQ